MVTQIIAIHAPEMGKGTIFPSGVIEHIELAALQAPELQNGAGDCGDESELLRAMTKVR